MISLKLKQINMKYILYALFCGILINSVFVLKAQEITYDVAFSESELHDAGVIYIKANHKVTGDKTISGNSEVTYHAGDMVVLKPGFEVKSGSVFHASTDRQEEVLSEDENADQDLFDFSPNQSFMNVYPNPNQGFFKIAVDAQMIKDKFGDGAYRMIVYNAKGEIVADKAGKKSLLYDFNFTGLTKGVYFLKLFNNSKKNSQFDSPTELEFRQIIIE